MYGFLYNDFKISKQNILIMFGCLVLLSLFFISPVLISANTGDTDAEENKMVMSVMGAFGVFVHFMLIDGIGSTIVTCDERKKWAYYVASSEKGIRDYVASKYIFVLIVTYLGSALCMVLNTIMIDVFGSDVITDFSMIYLYVISTVLFLKSIEIPCLLAFTSKYGTNIRLLLIGVISFGLVVYLLFGDLTIFGTEDEIWTKIFHFFETDRSAEFVIISSAIGIFAYVLYYLSYRLSCRIYMKGTENYDK